MPDSGSYSNPPENGPPISGDSHVVDTTMYAKHWITLIVLWGMLMSLFAGFFLNVGGEEVAPQVAVEQIGRPRCWVYSHLHKCGGSTIKEILEANLGSRMIQHRTQSWSNGKSGNSAFMESLPTEEPFVVVGGYVEKLRYDLGKACQWFAVFRHPIPRLVSAYLYCKGGYVDSLCAAKIMSANGASVVDFARHWGNFGFRQLSLGFLEWDDVRQFAASAGDEGGDLGERISTWYVVKLYLEHKGRSLGGDESRALRDMKDQVFGSIGRDYAVVGLLEEFETTLNLFDRVLQIPDVNWTLSFSSHGKRNVAHVDAAEKAAVLEEAWGSAEVWQYISLDLELYELARNVFRNQTAMYGL